ncbi:STN domain-containing protein [Stenotrophomonas rhizophila]
MACAAPGVQRAESVDAALSQLLAGTGLTFHAMPKVSCCATRRARQ